MKQNIFNLSFIIILNLTLVNISSQAQIYVNLNATGANNGASWSDAYSELQPAIDAASSLDHIWVAEGTYKPTEYVDGAVSDNRNKSFHVAGKSIKIYGGFSGTETTVNQRDIINHPTIFSGDFNDDDVITGSGGNLNFAHNTENAYHVFVLAPVSNYANTIFNGVTFIGGNANQSTSYNYGGISVDNSNGAAIYAVSDIVKIIIENCKISNNSANNHGGGLYSYTNTSAPARSSTITIQNSTISDNKTLSKGGGIYSYAFSYSATAVSSITVQNSTISGNYGDIGAGLYSYSKVASGTTSSSSTVTVQKSTIVNNSATSYGGGLCSYSGGASANSSILVEYSTISHNSATGNGGAIYSTSDNTYSLEMISSLIWTNDVSAANKNIYNNHPSASIISGGNNLFSDNPNGNIPSDIPNVSSANLNLQALSFNGGDTKTRIPGIGSIAIDAGNMTNSNAQNRSIIGTRDVGAAEYNCIAEIIDTKTSCSNFTWINGTTYTTNNSSATYTVYSNTNSICDTTYTLNLNITNVDNSITQSNAVLTATESGATYQWVDCNNNNTPINGETSQYYTPTTNGNYAVIITKNGCSTTSNCMIVNNISSITNNENIFGVSIYPNPTINNVTIEFEDIDNVNYIINVYNLIGEIVLTKSVSRLNTLLNTTNLESSIYFIEIKTESVKQIYRLIIQ